MGAGALYGVFIGSMIAILTTLLPAPIGWCIFWSALTVQLSVGAVVVWRRVRLPAMAVGFALGAVEALTFAVFAAFGVVPQEIFLRYRWVMALLLLLNPGLMYSEKWLHREQWRLLEAEARHARVTDVLAFRHIPDLRHQTSRGDV